MLRQLQPKQATATRAKRHLYHFLINHIGKPWFNRGKESDLRKSKYEGFDTRCMEIKSGLIDFCYLGHQLILGDPKQIDAKDVSKSGNNENRSPRNSGVSA